MEISEGRARVVIEGVKPEIDCGRFPIKRIVGDKVVVEADVFADGNEMVSVRLRYRKEDVPGWTEVPMEHITNDRWRGAFTVGEVGRYLYTLTGWVDRFKSWRNDFAKRVATGDQDIPVHLLSAAQLIADAAGRAAGPDRQIMKNWAQTLKSAGVPHDEKVRLALDEVVASTMDRNSDRQFAVTYPRELSVMVERDKARFSSWYEMFPRSSSARAGRHGTFRDCEARLAYVAEMGFDVLYFPPIHPIGFSCRKGRNNCITAGPDDPGTPWAIGSEEGGHKAINPQLGTMRDFKRLVNKAEEYGIEIALDISFHCSVDHPYVKEHPEWFRWRPDGTIQYAENPPNKYQDIYPFNFETVKWRELWEELKSVIVFWIKQGIRIFRVDNPHTKPFSFWEWLVNDIKRENPDVQFLVEAFTRPKLMYRLSKLGFTQS